MPWGISHKYKFIFIHIPKTAGTTICSSWEGSILKQICRDTGVLGGGHKTVLQLKKKFPKEFKTYLKFTVVRNPYDRFVSKFYFKQRKPRKEFELEWSDKEVDGLLPQLFWITDNENIYKKMPPDFRPELHYGNIIVDRVLRFENLNFELESVFNELGLPKSVIDIFPHFRQTRAEFTYDKYFDEKLKSICAYLYREDLKRFDYSWMK